jgi:hypothetical protein
MQDVAIKQSMVLRTVRPCSRRVLKFTAAATADSAGRKQFEFPKLTPDLGECLPSPNTLKNLAENEVAQPKTTPGKFVIEAIRFAIPETTEIVDPYCGINDDHCGDGSLKCPAESDLNRRPIGSCREGGGW